jgi:hypothetical protein
MPGIGRKCRNQTPARWGSPGRSLPTEAFYHPATDPDKCAAGACVEVTAAGLRRPLNEERHQDATRALAAAGMVVAQTSVDKLGGTPPAVQLTPLIAREHVVAVLEGAKLHLQARMVGSQWLDTGSHPTADLAEPVSGDSAGINTPHLGFSRNQDCASGQATYSTSGRCRDAAIDRCGPTTLP